MTATTTRLDEAMAAVRADYEAHRAEVVDVVLEMDTVYLGPGVRRVIAHVCGAPEHEAPFDVETIYLEDDDPEDDTRLWVVHGRAYEDLKGAALDAGRVFAARRFPNLLTHVTMRGAF